MELIRKNLKVCLMFTLLISIMFPIHVSAINKNDIDDGNLVIEWKLGELNLSNFTFNIYKIGEINEKGEISLKEEFLNYPINYKKHNQEEWNKDAQTLKGYIQRDNIIPSFKEKTNHEGIYRGKLETGLYLITGDIQIIDNYVYDSSPFFVLLPNNKTKIEKINIFPKITRRKTEESRINKNVIKIWKDNGYKKNRPKSIRVELLSDGKVFDSVVLSKENNWRHTWKDLDSHKNWNVVEQGVEVGDYTVSIGHDSDTFIVENTIVKAGTTPKINQKKLPQTGQMKWPINVFILLGSILVFIGYIKDKREKVNK